MPLPPLLLERLKRRKIIQEVTEDTSDSQQEGPHRTTTESSLESRYQGSQLAASNITPPDQEEEQEEIIAEDYSSDEDDGGQENECEKRDSDDTGDECDGESNDDHNDHDSNHHQNQTLRDKEHEHDQKGTLSRTESVIGCPNKYNIYHECSQYCIDKYSQPEDVSPTIEQRKQLALVLRTYPMSNEWTVVYDPGVRTFYFWNIISNLVSWFPPGMNGFVSLSADEIRKSMKEMDDRQEEENYL